MLSFSYKIEIYDTSSEEYLCISKDGNIGCDPSFCNNIAPSNCVNNNCFNYNYSNNSSHDPSPKSSSCCDKKYKKKNKCDKSCDDCDVYKFYHCYLQSLAIIPDKTPGAVVATPNYAIINGAEGAPPGSQTLLGYINQVVPIITSESCAPYKPVQNCYQYPVFQTVKPAELINAILQIYTDVYNAFDDDNELSAQCKTGTIGKYKIVVNMYHKN